MKCDLYHAYAPPSLPHTFFVRTPKIIALTLEKLSFWIAANLLLEVQAPPEDYTNSCNFETFIPITKNSKRHNVYWIVM